MYFSIKVKQRVPKYTQTKHTHLFSMPKRYKLAFKLILNVFAERNERVADSEMLQPEYLITRDCVMMC